MLELYRETAFEFKPNALSQRIDILVPRANGSYDRSKFSKKLERGDRLATDEKTFAAEYLASSSSVFFHHSQGYPRSFLWRVIGKDKLLEFTSIDFACRESDTEASVTISFEFQDRIAVRGVTVCSAGREVFHAFVTTQENDVFEIQLAPSYFQNPNPPPEDTRSWCKPIRASALSIERTFHVHAADPQNVFVSFVSGRIQHWKREGIDNVWEYVSYDDRTWGNSLFSLVSRKGIPDIYQDGAKFAHNAVHAMARSGSHLFTICLNHTLRIWHLASGKLVDTRDLLDEAREPGSVQLNPAEPGYIQFLESPHTDNHTLLTFSPMDGGQIKLWSVRNREGDESNFLTIEDKYPDVKLSLPDPDPSGTNVWSLAGLQVIREHSNDWQVWALWRNNNYHKAYSLVFGDPSTQWQNEWVTTSQPTIRHKTPYFSPDKTITQQWLRFIMFPGRYSRAVLETALAQYCSAGGARLSGADRTKAFHERIQILLLAQSQLDGHDGPDTDEERQARDLDHQWRRYWRFLETLNETRFAPLTLSVDSQSESVVFVMTDSAFILRESTNLEILQANSKPGFQKLSQIVRSRWTHREITFSTHEAVLISTFLSASNAFLVSWPAEVAASYLVNLDEELYFEDEPDMHERVVNLYNSLELQDSIPDELEKEMMKQLETIGGVSAVSDGIYNKVLEVMAEHKSHLQKSHYDKTTVGLEITLSALLEEVMNLRQVLHSMLAFVIYVDESDTFHASQQFERLLAQLRVQEKNLWLATNHMKPTSGEQPISVLQHKYGQIIKPKKVQRPMPLFLTQHTLDNLEWISSQNDVANLDDINVSIQCHLLRCNEIDLATDFQRFQPDSEWSTYVKGRLNLFLKEYSEASASFKQAAQSMSSGKARGKLTDLSSGLLSSEEAACFYGGQSLYLQHIMALFEKCDAHDEVIDFAHRTLEHLKMEKKEPKLNFKQSILIRLFHALLRTSRFEEAYNTLIQFSDPVLQRASATDLIDNMLVPNTSTDMISTVKKIQSMPIFSHPTLSVHVDHHLAALARKQTSIPSTGGKWLSSTSVDYLSILHALRLHKNDYRGAVSILFDRLRIIQKSGRARSDPQAVALRHALLALINAMTAVKEDEAYIVVDSNEDPRVGNASLKRQRDRGTSYQGPARKRQRVIVTLDDLRREYQKVLDRCSRIERGDFQLNGDDDESDGDEEMSNTTWHGTRLVVDRNRGDALGFGTADGMEF